MPSDLEIFQARVFTEPFVPTGETSAGENRAFADAIAAYVKGPNTNNIAVFEGFARAHPTSAWRASILANAGLVYRRTGRITKALEAFNEAWRLTADAGMPQASAVGQFAMGESLDMLASLGQSQLIIQQLERMGGRPMQGAAAAKAQLARFTLSHLQQYPDRVIPSGPTALRRIAAVLTVAPRLLKTLDTYVPTADGMSLAELRAMAAKVGISGVMATRTEAAAPVVPSIVHLRIGHFSALVQHDEERNAYLLDDPALGGPVWMDAQTLVDETSAFALLPANRLSEGWTLASDEDAEGIAGRSCPPGGPDGEGPCPNCPSNYGMAGYWFSTINAGLMVSDTPLGYRPPLGPAVEFALRYSSRDALLPQSITFGNQGPGWFNDWLSYAEERPIACGIINNGCVIAHVAVLLRGGGLENYMGEPDANGVYPSHYRERAALVRTSSSPIRYERRLPSGSVEVFGLSDAAPIGQRRVFLTKIIDPQGQALVFTYDAQYRLAAVTDAVGQVTTLAYEFGPDPLRLTQVTDPYGRSATLEYDGARRLNGITDVMGLKSSFVYGPHDMIASLTTPYGTTTFQYETNSTLNFTQPVVQATDPLGGTERLEFRWDDAGIAQTEAAATVPAGFAAANANLNWYNTVYWDKRAWSLHPGDTTKATITKWLLRAVYPGGDVIRSVAVPHSVKRPLENRVWYAYPGQTSAEWAGTHTTPSITARVLDDGATQRWEKTYNSQGQVLTSTDPLGRQTSYTYASNGLDLVEVRQTTGATNDVLASIGDFTALHQAQTITDAAGQSTTSTYNAAGQVLESTNAKQETTTYGYDGNGRISTISGPVTGSTRTYGYDTHGRLLTVTEDGHTVVILYDDFDRPIRTEYPDGTYEFVVYDRLDVSSRRDRAGRVTRYYYDALRRLTATRSPLGDTVRQEWCDCGTLDALVDGAGNRTAWQRDLLGRVIRESRANGSGFDYVYESTTGRLKRQTDAKGQHTDYVYALDNKLLQAAFPNAEVQTPTVSYEYDSTYGRKSVMVDGIGTTNFVYHANGQPGAGEVASIDGPWVNDTITYVYDQLGRVTTRSVGGVGVTWTFDGLGRTTSELNALGTFVSVYDGSSRRIASISYPNGQTIAYDYYPAISDQRLQTIHHKYSGGATLSKLDYTYDATGNVITWRHQADSHAVLWTYGYDLADQLTGAVKRTTNTPATVLNRFTYSYDSAGNRIAEQIDDTLLGAIHDNMNRLVSQEPTGGLTFSGNVSEPADVLIQGHKATVSSDNSFRATVPVTSGTNPVTIIATDPSGNVALKEYDVDSIGTARNLIYDLNGNLTADGTRTFEWDARNNLVAVNEGPNRSEFIYNGEGMRVRITDSSSGNLIRSSEFVWCDVTMCEERVPTSSVITRFFDHGVQKNGQNFYYGRDLLGSVRTISDNLGAVRGRYAYDPYGRLTSFDGDVTSPEQYTGHYFHAPSRLLFTANRAYEPELGRWLSEDPAGAVDGPNLYAYVRNQPTVAVDPLGLQLHVPGPRPSDATQPGCEASPWAYVGRYIESVERRTKWAIDRVIVVPIVSTSRAKADSAAGPCIVVYKQVGMLKVTTMFELWKRNVDCCPSAGYSEYRRTYQHFTADVPAIFAPRTVNKSGVMTANGCETGGPPR
jgi:RHS repeat-associated protein